IPGEGDPHFHALSDFVVARAMADWMYFATEYKPIRLAINLPVAVLEDPESVDRLRLQLPDHPAFNGLIVEINGHDMNRRLGPASDIARRLRFHNIGISIDDLGAEWPLLGQLDDVPFIELKVDRAFIKGCANDRLKRAACRTILDLAKRLGATTVAEGVETRDDFRAVQEMGFHQVQGFLFHKPMAARKFARTMLAAGGGALTGCGRGPDGCGARWPRGQTKPAGRARTRATNVEPACPMPVLVKICGLGTPDALDSALAAGADLVGFVFFPPSPRHLGLDVARTLGGRGQGRAGEVAPSGHARDATLDGIVEALQPDMLQLHGKESPARVAELKVRYRRPVMKAIPVETAADLAAVPAYVGIADTIIFDARAPRAATRPGGLGKPFDWRLLQDVDRRVPFMLSGGLDPANVAEALAITRAGGVDVSSGVERAPGEKDPDKIVAFIRAV